MKKIFTSIVFAFYCFGISVLSQAEQIPTLESPEDLQKVLQAYLGSEATGHPTGVIPLLFELNIGETKLRFLQLKDDGVFLASDNIPFAPSYIVLPIAPKLDSILEAKNLQELLNTLVGRKLKNAWEVFGNQLVKESVGGNKDIATEVDVNIAYPSPTYLTILKLNCIVWPGTEPPEQRRLVVQSFELNAVNWLQPRPKASPKATQ